jgi:hypothetical protein
VKILNFGKEEASRRSFTSQQVLTYPMPNQLKITEWKSRLF